MSTEHKNLDQLTDFADTAVGFAIFFFAFAAVSIMAGASGVVLNPLSDRALRYRLYMGVGNSYNQWKLIQFAGFCLGFVGPIVLWPFIGPFGLILWLSHAYNIFMWLTTMPLDDAATRFCVTHPHMLGIRNFWQVERCGFQDPTDFACYTLWRLGVTSGSPIHYFRQTTEADIDRWTDILSKNLEHKSASDSVFSQMFHKKIVKYYNEKLHEEQELGIWRTKQDAQVSMLTGLVAEVNMRYLALLPPPPKEEQEEEYVFSNN
jgi:hypothetical protein